MVDTIDPDTATLIDYKVNQFLTKNHYCLALNKDNTRCKHLIGHYNSGNILCKLHRNKKTKAKYIIVYIDNENSNEISNENSNEDNNNPKNKYTSGCGLSNCSVSFGHDEYMYRLLIANTHKMPKEAEYIVRYHSLYTWHSSTEYDYLEDEEDKKMKKIVKEFNNFDLYTKDDTLPIKWNNELIKYYSELVKKYISSQLQIKW